MDEKDKLAQQFGFPSWKALREATAENGQFFDANDYDETGIVPVGAKFLAYWGVNPYGELYDTWNDAAHAIIDGAKELYLEFHMDDDGNEPEAVVSEMTDGDGRIIGFCLSLDVDGYSRGEDEKYGAWE